MKKNTATFSKLIIAVYVHIAVYVYRAVYVSAVYVYISCTCVSSRLQYNFLIVGLGDWGVRGSEQAIRL
jgi:hypothetical protein